MNDELVKYKLVGTLKTTIAGKLIYGLCVKLQILMERFK